MTSNVWYCIAVGSISLYRIAQARGGIVLLETIKDERMYQAGLLRIVMKMKTEKKAFETCVTDVTDELRLDPDDFRRYVNTHMGEVVASVKSKGGRVYWEI